MDGTAEEIQRLIVRVHDSETSAVVVAAGAGTRAISWLMEIPGASRTVLEALIPYAHSSLVDFLGSEPAKVVSPLAASEMARMAYRRALRLRKGTGPVVGVACTGTIATDRPKRGDHLCHVAAWSAGEVKTYSLKLTKGLRSRSGEEAIVSSLVLRALAEQSRVDFDVPMHLAGPERVEVGGTRYADPIAAVLAGHVETATISLDGSASADVPVTGGVLPGSFDPIHEGHRQLLAVASDILSAEVTLELSVTNADKPPLSETELRRRLAQLRGKWTAVISRAPVFSRKAALFPGCTFVIGWDTAVRLFEPRYYGGDELEMLKALDRIRGLGCRFLIAGREDGGVFRTLADVPVPAGFEKMFTAIPESLFRFNISSTELRPANGKP